jgi:replicative DNA helicase
LRLQITARVRRVDQKGKGRDKYHVIVPGRDDLDRFIDHVGAVGSRRVAVLGRIEAVLDERGRNTNRDVIPAGVWQRRVRPAMAGAGVSHRDLARGTGMAYMGSGLFEQNPGGERAARVARVVGSGPLERLSSSHVHWDQISSMEEAGTERVYDLTVPGPHNFIASTCVVHNSIEQDSDLVMFLYRPEYYFGPVDKDGNNIEGQSELIIAKQRNGPTGMVPLFFHKAYTRFDSVAREGGDGGYAGP